MAARTTASLKKHGAKAEEPQNLRAKKTFFGVKACSPFLDVPGLDLVKACPIDAMHAVDLGVTKKMILLLFDQNTRQRNLVRR